MTAEQRHLWEFDHPYYCGEATWYSRYDHTRWGSWAQFRDETIFTTGDRDMNLLVRWDWRSWRRTDGTRSAIPDELCLYFVMQCKGHLCSHYITVTDDDEPEVRAWLAECAATVAQMWQPLAVTATDPDRTILAVLREMDWPDDREEPVHVESDIHAAIAPGVYWGMAESVVAAMRRADAEGAS